MTQMVQMRVSSTWLQALLLGLALPLATAEAQVLVEGGLVNLWSRSDGVSNGEPTTSDRGWELRALFQHRYLGLGAGVMRLRLSNDSGEPPATLVAYSVRPRINLRPGRRIDPFVEGVFSSLKVFGESAILAPFRFEEFGRMSGAGGGIVVSVGNAISLEGSGEWGRAIFNRANVNGVPEKVQEEGRGHFYIARGALVVRLPRLID